MCVARTARRRRKQAKMGYRHIHKAKRPHYSRTASGGSITRKATKK